MRGIICDIDGTHVLFFLYHLVIYITFLVVPEINLLKKDNKLCYCVIWEFSNILYLNLLDAVRKNPLTKSETDDTIETVMKDWLKYASDRDGGRKRRKARTTPDEQNEQNQI